MRRPFPLRAMPRCRRRAGRLSAIPLAASELRSLYASDKGLLQIARCQAPFPCANQRPLDDPESNKKHRMNTATEMRAGLTPVTILTGFLGAGKTTILNRLLIRCD